jgi:hypothetical protein
MIAEWIPAVDADGRYHVIRTHPDHALGPFDTLREAEAAIQELLSNKKGH